MLSDDQQATLIEKLKDHPARIEIVTPFQDGEARNYAGSFEAAFKEAGWDVAPINGQSSVPCPGYVLLGGSDPNMSPVLSEVAEALRSIGVDLRDEPVLQQTIGHPFERGTGYLVIGGESQHGNDQLVAPVTPR